MAERDELLTAVIASPDSDQPRHAFADWCEESGDSERADFIRLQCSLHGDSLSPGEREALERREEKLLQDRGWDWADEFGLDVSEWVFERGFVERVELCIEASAEQILGVLEKSPIRHIRDTSQLCDLKGLVEALPYLGHLTGLELWGLYAVDDALVRQILLSPELQRLKTLVLHHDRNGNLVDEQVLIEALRSPYRENIEELAINVDCSWRGPSNEVIGAIADSPYLRNLRRLNLSNAGDAGNNPQLTVQTIRRLATSPNLANLEELDLRAVHATSEVWAALLEMPQLTSLKKAWLCEAAEVGTPWIPIVGYVSEMPQWRAAFEQRVAEVDWESRFIDPWNGGVWRGISWGDRKKQLLFGMHSFVCENDYDGLEQRYREVCEKLAGTERAERINELPFDAWHAQIRESLVDVLAVAEKRSSDTVFLRIRPDIDWGGEFGVYDKYSPSEFVPEPVDTSKPFEEFSYSSPNASTNAPSFEAAAELFKDAPLTSGTGPSGTALYLIARSVSAFGRCLSESDVCPDVYFSCMWAVFRMT